jgi:hypothetical protein
MKSSPNRPEPGRSGQQRRTGRGRSSEASAPSADLPRDARQFAGELSEILNATACDCIRIKAVVSKTAASAWIGYQPDSRQLVGTRGIPLALGRRAPRCWLDLSFVMGTDQFGQHLMVLTSYLGLYADADLTQVLVHYDYERDKADGYPDAHLQIPARSPHWAAVLARCPDSKDELEHLHLPTGGRRFRPTVEDIIEFVIIEKLADARPDWREALKKSRDVFLERQLRAAVRRHPDVAIRQLRRMGHTIVDG